MSSIKQLKKKTEIFLLTSQQVERKHNKQLNKLPKSQLLTRFVELTTQKANKLTKVKLVDLISAYERKIN